MLILDFYDFCASLSGSNFIYHVIVVAVVVVVVSSSSTVEIAYSDHG